MTIDFWGLGLQAINVLILVWLLSRVFWRPVAQAIAKRQDTAHVMLDAAKTAQTEVDQALAELTQAREGIESERSAVLAKAAKDGATATKVTLAQARDKADKLIAAAKRTITRDVELARKQNAAQIADLSVDIAAKLLLQLSTPAVQETFLGLLVDAVEKMAPNERAAIVAVGNEIDLISAEDIDEAGKAKVTKAVKQALGGSPEFNFVTDPGIIAGLEIRTPHFMLHNSWQSDLAKIRKDLQHAA